MITRMIRIVPSDMAPSVKLARAEKSAATAGSAKHIPGHEFQPDAGDVAQQRERAGTRCRSKRAAVSNNES
jgi:hypothetical protein